MKLKYFMLLIIVVVLFANVPICVSAINTGFSVEKLTEAEQSSFVENIELTLLITEPEKKTINCFDVSSNHLIAMGHNTSGKKSISVYSNEGVFQFGYSFNCSGYFGVEWDEEKLNIYFVRSGVLISVTPKGEVLSVFKIPNTIENNSYINHFIYKTTKTIGDTEYSIRNNMGVLNFIAPSYSQIVVKNSIGEESIIYDVGAMQLSNIILTIVIVAFVVLIAFIAIFKQMKNSNNTGSNNTGDGSKPLKK